MDNLEICFMSALDLAGAIRDKRLSPVEVMKAFVRRIEQVNPQVNAYCTLLSEAALRQAKEAEDAVMRKEKLGRLHGVPVSIKDLIFTKGVRTTGGSKIYAHFVPEQDATVVERLKAAGAIVLGKTNTSEFGWVGVTDNRLFGPTRNPWNLAMHAGGSSGGAAASVAAGMGPLAIGSDGGGSIRVPASFCGVFGFKASFGRVPQYPGFPGWENLSHTGPITRTVRDAALAMEIIGGKDDRDRHSLPDTGLSYLPSLTGDLKGIRIAYSPDLGYAAVDPRVKSVTDRAAMVFESLGAAVELAYPGTKSPESPFSLVVGSMLAATLQDKMVEWESEMDPGLVRFVRLSENRLATEYVRASLELSDYWSAVRPFFGKYDLLLTPTAAVPPFEVGRTSVREIDGVRVSAIGWMPFTYPFNITGQPAASVSCGWTDDGLPVGLQVVGRRFDDVTVLKAAAAFEEAQPWTDKRPLIG